MRKIAILSLLLFVIGLQASAMQVVVQDFEGNSVGKVAGEKVQPASTITLSNHDAYAGKNCAEVHYAFAQVPGIQYIVLPLQLAVNSPAQRISFAVRGDGSGCPVRMRIVDAGKEWHQYNVGFINFTGWKVLSLDLGTKAGDGTWGGDGNHQLNYPISLDNIVFDHPDKLPAEGTIAVDRVTVDTNASVEDFTTITVAPAAKYGYFWGTTNPPKFILQATSSAIDEVRIPVSMRVYNHRNEPVGQPWNDTITMKNGASVTKEIPLKISAFGVYTLDVQYGKNRSRLSFSWLKEQGKIWPEGPFGVCTHFGQGKYTEDMPGMVQIIKNMGATWFRDEISWGGVERSKGVYAFADYPNQFMKATTDAGLKPFLIFDYANGLYDNGLAPYTDDCRTAFGRYIQAMMKQYGNVCHDWEIWNEPNGSGFWRPTPSPAGYAKLMSVAYPVAKAANPKDTFAGIALAGIATPYIETVLQNNGAKNMDVLSVHPYCYPRSPENAELLKSLEAVHTLTDQYGAKKMKLWLTEFGYPTQLDSRGVTQARSAAYMVREFVLAFSKPYVERTFFYDIKDDGQDPKYNEHNFGLIAYNWSPKVGYGAYNTMSRKLYQERYARAINVSNDIQCHEFTGNAGPVMVCWALTGAETLAFTSAAKEITVTDLMGNECRMTPSNGAYVIALTEEPIFITGYKGFRVSSSPITFTGNTLCSQGESVTITMKAGKVAAKQTWTPSVPQDWRISDLGNGQYRITPPATLLPGDYPVIFTSNPGSAVAKISLRDAVMLSTRLQTPGAITAELENPFDRPRDIVLHATSAGQGIAEQRVTMAPRSKKTIDVAIPTETNDGLVTKPVDVYVTPAPGVKDFAAPTSPAKSLIMGLTPAYMMQNVTMDGNLAEWQAKKPCLLTQPYQVVTLNGAAWNGVNDLSARMWVGWDQTNCYVAVETTDDVHSQNNEPANLWIGDNLQCCFGVNGTRYEFDMGLTDDKRVLVFQNAPKSTTPEGLKAIINRAGTKTTYEVSIPWALVGVKDPLKQPITFAMLTNDNDGKGRKGWMEWHQGIGLTKDASLYSPLKFISAK